jgi:hypothetical protein
MEALSPLHLLVFLSLIVAILVGVPIRGYKEGQQPAGK